MSEEKKEFERRPDVSPEAEANLKEALEGASLADADLEKERIATITETLRALVKQQDPIVEGYAQSLADVALSSEGKPKIDAVLSDAVADVMNAVRSGTKDKEIAAYEQAFPGTAKELVRRALKGAVEKKLIAAMGDQESRKGYVDRLQQMVDDLSAKKGPTKEAGTDRAAG